jgi:hypothetical protein
MHDAAYAGVYVDVDLYPDTLARYRFSAHVPTREKVASLSISSQNPLVCPAGVGQFNPRVPHLQNREDLFT